MTQGFKAEIFIEIAPPALLPRNDGILDGIASVALLPRNDGGNSRIPYRDPPRGLGDDIVGNSRISRLKSLGILEFLSN